MNSRLAQRWPSFFIVRYFPREVNAFPEIGNPDGLLKVQWFEFLALYGCNGSE